MNRRVWGIVAVFASIAALLVTWMLLANGPRGDAAGEGAAADAVVRKTPIRVDRAVKLDPNRSRVAVRDRVLRQQRTTAAGTAPAAAGVPVEGVFPLDQDGIARAVQERKADMQACYETALFHTPGIAGKMTLSLQIEPEPDQAWGRVVSVESDSTLDATVLEGCIATVFEELRFDAREPITIRYPVAFEPGG